MKGSQVYKHGDHAYIVIRQKMIFTFAKTFEAEPDMELVQQYMQWCGADHVLRSPSHFMFCETIPEVEFEEITHERIANT